MGDTTSKQPPADKTPAQVKAEKSAEIERADQEGVTTIDVARAFTLTLDDGTQRHFNVGKQEVPAHIAEHWFTKAHLVGAVVVPPPGSMIYVEQQRQRVLKLQEEERAREEAAAKEREEQFKERVRQQQEAAQMRLRANAEQAQASQAAADAAKTGAKK